MSHAPVPQLSGAMSPGQKQTVAAAAADSTNLSLLPAESGFYNQYHWCLNPFLTIRDIVCHLQEELDRLVKTNFGWQHDEICKNIYLLSCAILDSVDDSLLGRTYNFSRIATAVPQLRPLVSCAERLYNFSSRPRFANAKRLAPWKAQWQLALVRTLKILLAGPPPDKQNHAQILTSLDPLLTSPSLHTLLHRRVRIPRAFRSHDLSHCDVLALGRKFVANFPDRQQSIVIMGLRTAGSYFAPLLQSYLEAQNYRTVESFTVRPKSGLSRQEMTALARCAATRSRLVIIDEPIRGGNTLLEAVRLAQQYSIERHQVVILVPIHPSVRHAKESIGYQLLSDLFLLTLEPEEWHKYQSLDAETKKFANEYFQARRISVCDLSARTPLAARFNRRLDSISERKGHDRLKRVYEVRLSTEAAGEETRYILSKSVGWGWLSYQAFLAGERLGKFVTPLLGLRNGILYTEWQPDDGIAGSKTSRAEWIDRAASYIAARVQSLRLEVDPVPELILESKNQALRKLASSLCQAYGARPAQHLKQGRMLYELSRTQCPCPTLIDGKMRAVEWIRGSSGPLKSDFEHHGLGPIENNMTDPAFDVADFILGCKLSSEEEDRLVTRYIQDSGDVGVADRLLTNKLVAGLQARDRAVANLEDPRLIARRHEFNRDYITAWNFLILHTMRYCAKLCSQPENMVWRGPLVVMDVDGVLDKQAVGFPSITFAGIQALSLLHSHNIAIVLNTARSIPEVKEYCTHYNFLGGVAEYGSFAWDAIGKKGEILVSEESQRELRALAEALRNIPGIFLNDDYLYSIRAYTFQDGITRPIPTLLIQSLIPQLGLTHLRFQQTYRDTAVVAKETDKGKGLLALLLLAGHKTLPTIAIGDSEADLSMFAVADSSFAPGHISCRSHARAVGCHVDPKPYQRGLLNIVRQIIHPQKDGCERCRSAEAKSCVTDNVVIRVLKDADESKMKRFFSAICDPMVPKSFLAS